MDTKPMFSSLMSDASTPQWLFDRLHQLYHFTLDGAANAENHKLDRWLGPGSKISEDGITYPWIGETVFLNPPYGKEIGKWVHKAFIEADEDRAKSVCLLPARTDTQWWWNWARFGDVRFLKGRLKFSNLPHSAPFPSAIVVFDPMSSAMTTGNGNHTFYWEVKPAKVLSYIEEGEDE